MITLRAPSTSSASSKNNAFTLPSADWLHGTWNVTHSTLPMWKSKQNVQITYAPIAGTDQHIDDEVSYRELGSDKVKTIKGVDKPTAGVPGAWDWRGKGWLMIASSHWELLGCGEEDSSDGEEKQRWAVTYFAKTMFTPAGIDIYSRTTKGLKEETVEEIKKGLKGLGDSDVETLAGQIFKVASW